MIRVHRPAASVLSRSVRADVAGAQATADSYSRGDAEIERQWNNFRRRAAGRAVWDTLSDAFYTKCVFCERVNAKTLDHYRPKERYPKKMFRWNNLLLCCSDCNRAKGASFAFKMASRYFSIPHGMIHWSSSSGTLQPER